MGKRKNVLFIYILLKIIWTVYSITIHMLQVLYAILNALIIKYCKCD